MAAYLMVLWIFCVTLLKTAEINCSRKPLIAPLNFIPAKPSAGSLARTYCNVIEGDHPITIAWMHNGKRIEKSQGNIEIKKDDDTSVILKIKDVDISNIGNYTCVASNDAGFDSHTIPLKFEGPPKWIQNPPGSMDILVGQMANLPCTTAGYPVPRSKWFVQNCPAFKKC